MKMILNLTLIVIMMFCISCGTSRNSVNVMEIDGPIVVWTAVFGDGCSHNNSTWIEFYDNNKHLHKIAFTVDGIGTSYESQPKWVYGTTYFGREPGIELSESEVNHLKALLVNYVKWMYTEDYRDFLIKVGKTADHTTNHNSFEIINISELKSINNYIEMPYKLENISPKSRHDG